MFLKEVPCGSGGGDEDENIDQSSDKPRGVGLGFFSKDIPGALRCGSGFLFALCGTEGAVVFPDDTLFTKTFAAHGAAGGSFTITMIETV